MNNENSNSMRDMELLKKAKMNVWLKGVYKWLWAVYIIVNALLLVVWFFTYRGFFWPGLVMASWGFGLLMLGVIIGFINSPTKLDDRVADEYNRLKNTAIKNRQG